MSNKIFDYASNLVPNSYLTLGVQAINARENRIKELFHHVPHKIFDRIFKPKIQNPFKFIPFQKKLPNTSWDDLTIEYFLNEMAILDSNNFLRNVGVGEREGRIFSDLVARRHFRMTHGIGRSGDIKSVQPKAAGSSLVNALTNALVLDAIKISGIKGCKNCFVVPTATGMALTLCLLYFRRHRPQASFVIWSRIDQKSCFKCILTAGFEPYVVQLKLNGDDLCTDLSAIENAIENLGVENIVCVLTTTSCFAPRVPDDVIGVSKLCKRFNIPHLVNNAYGLQSDSICNKIEEAGRIGRVDAFVQSADKNFMVPVGGAIIAGFDSDLIDSIAQNYPGRASACASTDLLITLLSMGADGYTKLRRERKEMFEYFKAKLKTFSTQYGEVVLETPKNPISLAMSLSKLDENKIDNAGKSKLTLLGSMLFTRQCSGGRVVPKNERKVIENYEFVGWMSHCESYKCSYINVAAAIGIQKNEIDDFFRILNECFVKLNKSTVVYENGIDDNLLNSVLDEIKK